MANQKTAPVPKVHHYARTMTAAVLGALALLLVSASIMLVWANRTLTDTNTYVQTVGPVLASPALQDFVAGKVADQLLAAVPLPDLVNSLLGPGQAGATPEAQQQQVRSIIHDSVVQLMASPQIQTVWADTNRQAHAQLINGLNTNASQIAINLGPLQDAIVASLKQSKLAPVADKFDTGTPGQTAITLTGAPLERIHSGYKLLRTIPWLIVAAALVLGGLAVWISVNHAKTLRRMLIDVGLSSLAAAGGVALVSRIQLPAADPAAAKVASALVGTLLHGLQVALLVLGAVCLIAAVGSKLYSRARAGKA